MAATAQEALIAELLGDVGRLHDHIKALPAALQESVAPSLEAVALATAEARTTIDKYADAQKAMIRQQAALRLNEEVEKACSQAAQLIDASAKANRNINASKWLAMAGAVCLVIAGFGFTAGYWLAATSNENADLCAGKTFGRAEGRAAVSLAEFGQARMLLECSAPGWTVKDGFCFGTPKDGKTMGWRIK